MEFDSRAINGFYAKDEKIVEGVYHDTFKLLKFVIFGYLHDNSRSDELVLEVYMKAFKNRFEGKPNNFKAWLCQIARNLAKDELRKSLDADELPEVATTESKPSSLFSELQSLLNENEFEVLMLHAYFDFGFKEISSICLLPSSSSARGIYKRARDKAKTYLEKEYRQ